MASPQPNSPIALVASREKRVYECPAGHGRFESSLVAESFLSGGGSIPQHWSRCPTCEAEFESDQERRRAAARARLVSNLLASSGIEGRYTRARFDTYSCNTEVQRKALAACVAYASTESPGGSLLLVGKPGTGKTMLATAGVRHVIEQTARRAEIVTFSALVRRVRDTWRRESAQTESDVLESLASAELLAIDDIGATFGSEAERKTLLDVIDARYTRELRTVIVSNLTLPELEEAVGDRCFDRLRERAQCVPFTWASYRRTAA